MHAKLRQVKQFSSVLPKCDCKKGIFLFEEGNISDYYQRVTINGVTANGKVQVATRKGQAKLQSNSNLISKADAEAAL